MRICFQRSTRERCDHYKRRTDHAESKSQYLGYDQSE